MCRHTNTATGNDIDAAAMEFERRFHISVDASEDREQQVEKKTHFMRHETFSALSLLEINYFALFTKNKMHVSVSNVNL